MPMTVGSEDDQRRTPSSGIRRRSLTVPAMPGRRRNFEHSGGEYSSFGSVKSSAGVWPHDASVWSGTSAVRSWLSDLIAAARARLALSSGKKPLGFAHQVAHQLQAAILKT